MEARSGRPYRRLAGAAGRAAGSRLWEQEAKLHSGQLHAGVRGRHPRRVLIRRSGASSDSGGLPVLPGRPPLVIHALRTYVPLPIHPIHIPAPSIASESVTPIYRHSAHPHRRQIGRYPNKYGNTQTYPCRQGYTQTADAHGVLTVGRLGNTHAEKGHTQSTDAHRTHTIDSLGEIQTTDAHRVLTVGRLGDNRVSIRRNQKYPNYRCLRGAQCR